MTPKPVSIATNRTVYFKPSLTPSGDLRKTNQRIDKKNSTVDEKISQDKIESKKVAFHTPISVFLQPMVYLLE